MSAKFTFKLAAESGYEAEGEYKITPEQYGQIVAILNNQPAAQSDSKDAALLDAIRDNSWGLVPVDVPTGGDDYEIQWQVIEYHMANPTERVIAQAGNDEPRAAIRAALAQQADGEKS